MGARHAVVGIRRDGLLEELERLLEVALLPGLEGEPVEGPGRFVGLVIRGGGIRAREAARFPAPPRAS